MNGKELIKKVIEFGSPERVGLNFNEPNQTDIAVISPCRLKNEKNSHIWEWGRSREILKHVPGFKGQVTYDDFGNIFGRYDDKGWGECIKGILQDGWGSLDSFVMPEYDIDYEVELEGTIAKNTGKFLVGSLPVSPFSTSRDMRRLENLLMDMLLEEGMVNKLLKKIEELSLYIIEKASQSGFDAVFIHDDWGMQNALLANPAIWRKIFKPVYANLVEETHKNGMKYIMHSCGYVYEIIEDLIEIGIDVLQFDQPELIGVEKLAEKFGGRVCFWCPVDIQKIMQTGDRNLIENEARKMIKYMGSFNGGFIAKDYPSWDDICVKDEWAQWARDIFISEGIYSNYEKQPVQDK